MSERNLRGWFAACRQEAIGWPRGVMLAIASIRCLAALFILVEFAPAHHAAAPWLSEMLIVGFGFTLVLLGLEASPRGGKAHVLWWLTPFVEAALIGALLYATPPDAPFRWIVLVHALGCGVHYGARFSLPVILQHNLQVLVLDLLHPPHYPMADLILALLTWSFLLVFAHFQRTETEKRRQVEREVERVRELEALSNAKLQFINIASHELRTPLTVIKGYARLLETLAISQPDSPIGDFVLAIRRASERMTLLIDELLEFGRMQSGQMTLAREDFDLGAMLTDVSKVLSVLAFDRQHHLEVRLPSGLGPCQADPRRLEQVVLNLAHNALKYSPPGSTVVLEARSTPETWVIEVRDQGPGIPAEHLAHLFTPFFRAGAEHTGVEGMGLGLAISRAIAAAHGGALHYERQGDWTCFRVEWPREATRSVEAVSA